MSSGIWLDVSSLGILTILFIIYQYRNDIPIRQNKLLMSMAELAATATVCDIFCGLSVEGFILSTDWGYYVVKGLMVLAQSAISYCFFLYVQAIVKQKRTPSQRLWPQYAPFIIQIAAIMVNAATRSRDFLEGPRITQFEFTTQLIFLISVYFIVRSVLIIYVHKKSITPYFLFALGFFLVITYAGSTWQIINPNIRIGNFTVSLGLLNLYLTVQNPEEIVDGQTGCLNRNAFTKMTDVCIEAKHPLIVIITGIFDYPFLSDLMDAASFSILLSGYTRFLAGFSPKADVYRINDDQFALVMKKADWQEARIIGKNALQPFSQQWKTSTVTTSVDGYSCILRYPSDFITLDEFFALSEQLRHRSGKPEHVQLIINANSLDLTKGKRRQTVSNLVQLADERNMRIVFHPIYCAQANGINRLTASLALFDPTTGLVGQDEFMPLAEQNRSIFKFSEYLINRCCRLLGTGQLQALGFEHLTLVLSSGQWMQYGLPDMVRSNLRENKVSPSLLSFRIECKALNQAPQTMLMTLNELYRLGINIVITGYGVGFGEVNTTFRLPKATIAIGSEFFATAHNREESELVIQSSITLFKKFGYDSCVEGVATEQQRDSCLAMGADYLTGPLFGGPSTLEELAHVH